MSRRVVQPLIYMVIGLAILGFIWKLFTDPMGLFTQLLITAVIAALFIFLVRKFMTKRMGKQSTSYQKAAKQSSKMQKKKSAPRRNAPHLRVIPSKRLMPKKRSLQDDKKQNPFTVIEGRKGKKKNRALF
ncbi:SA1362 family protein [Guptibacillus hwajinpoensis]|uniref:Lipid-binding transport protein (Tim44 family) n=1 Tax=Guptibacillus hwajinpoensis TaxID=208199 RepID=A0ABU0JX81_9BACL|nr:SA1362 family protein [Alkalihalobacillus hemicentroti]MDQ0481697.1 putative lipid-binding transport protein (Tim44 family) [Alkalihalobacillus hemicentroti]